jgi:hypothetical protein
LHDVDVALDLIDQAAAWTESIGHGLDVVCHNEPLRRYYERTGFAHVRDMSGEWTSRDGTRRAWQTSLYERPCP